MMPLPVPREHVDAYFPVVAGYLEKAIKHNRCSSWTVRELWNACANGDVHLYVDDYKLPKNAICIQILTWDYEPVLYIALMGGEGGADWGEAFKHIREIATQNGIKRVVANLRDGWLKKFKTKRLATLCEIEE